MVKKYKSYGENLKKQVVELINNGKSIHETSREYDIPSSTIRRWLDNYNNSGSFKLSDNRTEEETELIALRKRNKQLEMENDILKQAALIMGRK